MQHILALCIGNICRSPLAEALIAREFPGKTVWSAGLDALAGKPAAPLSLEVAATHGLDLSAHRAQQVTGWMCQRAELILVMEQDHKAQLEQRFPWVRGKVFRLGEHGQFDITDPYRKPRSAFDSVFAAVEQGVAQWVGRICQLDAHARQHEAFLPVSDSGPDLAGASHDLVNAAAVRCHQDDPGAPDMLLRAVPVRYHRFQPNPISGAQLDNDSCAHHPNSHAGKPTGLFRQPLSTRASLNKSRKCP
jgi:protein-tyrosine phosphatase